MKQRIMSVLIVLCLVLGIILPVFAEGVRALSNRDDAKWLCDMFMINMTELDPRDAFGLLRPYSAVPEEEFEQLLVQSDTLIEKVKPDYGELVGYTLVQEKHVKNVVLQYTYLLRFEKHALRWRFFFYRPDKEWVFNEFKVDNKLTELFD